MLLLSRLEKFAGEVKYLVRCPPVCDEYTILVAGGLHDLAEAVQQENFWRNLST